MAQENFTGRIKAAQEILELFRLEQKTLTESIGTDPKRLEIVLDHLARIRRGLREAELSLSFWSCFKDMDSDKQTLLLRIQELLKENAALYECLTKSQQRMQQLKGTTAQHQKQRKRAKSKKSTKKLNDEKKPSNEQCEDLKRELRPNGAPKEEMLSSTSHQPKPNSSDSDFEVPKKFETVCRQLLEYISQGNYEPVVPLCTKTLEEAKTILGLHHPIVTALLNIMSSVYRDQRKYQLATIMLHKVPAIQEKTLGETHRDDAKMLNNLAVVHGLLRQYQEAEKYCRRALEVHERSWGENHPDVASQLLSLGSICQNQSKHAEAELYYERALRIYESVPTPDNTDLLRAKFLLANSYHWQGKLNKAEVLYKPMRAARKAEARSRGRKAKKNPPKSVPASSTDGGLSAKVSIPSALVTPENIELSEECAGGTAENSAKDIAENERPAECKEGSKKSQNDK